MTDARIHYEPDAAIRPASGLLEWSERGVLTIDLRDRSTERQAAGGPVGTRPPDAPLIGSPQIDEVSVADMFDDTAADLRAAGAAVRGRSVLALAAGLAIAAASVALGVTLLGRPLGLAAVAAVLVALVLVYRFLVQPWHVRWGATDAEVRAALPGDELLENAPATTRAVTIDAPVEQVWDWLVQLGIGPGGWTTRGLIDDARPGRWIVPRLRDLRGGRSRSMPGAGFEVHRIEAPSTIVSQGPDGTSWCLAVDDAGHGRSRLISRFRTQFDLVPGSSMVLADPAAFLAERRMLRAVKARAESGAPLQGRGCPCAP